VSGDAGTPTELEAWLVACARAKNSRAPVMVECAALHKRWRVFMELSNTSHLRDGSK
jgi:hypothetical protein